jgi:hypothetical protein
MDSATCEACNAFNSLRLPCSERLSVRRMRESRTSGATRRNIGGPAWQPYTGTKLETADTAKESLHHSSMFLTLLGDLRFGEIAKCLI